MGTLTMKMLEGKAPIKEGDLLALRYRPLKRANRTLLSPVGKIINIEHDKVNYFTSPANEYYKIILDFIADDYTSYYGIYRLYELRFPTKKEIKEFNAMLSAIKL